MPIVEVNGVALYYEVTGNAGDPLALVHGSWVDHHSWDLIVPSLARSFKVLTYDRRGHSESERPKGRGSIREDVSDLAELIEHLGLTPAHILGNSFGGCIALRLAAKRPDLFRSLLVHEPPLMGLLLDDPEMRPVLDEFKGQIAEVVKELEAGNAAVGARLFAERVALHAGVWERFPEPVKRTFITNAPTWLDQIREPNALDIDLESLRRFKHPALFTQSDESPPWLHHIVSKLAQSIEGARQKTIAGAGHVPHMSHPKEYVESILSFIATTA